MTVRDLIALLTTCPPDAVVVVRTDDSEFDLADEVLRLSLVKTLNGQLRYPIPFGLESRTETPEYICVA